VSLNGWAGKTIGTNLGVSVEGNTPKGVNWDSRIADIALVSVDGTVHTLFNQQNVSASTGNSSSGSNFAILTSTDTVPETHFYLGDHLGTAQMEFAGEGWPVWQGQFAPFGGELDSQTTANHYKFTQKERDAESGLDYFGARYYGSNMGRFMSPDWSSSAAPVPYANLSDPQSLNLYSYAGNNPLSRFDLDGHCWTGFSFICNTVQRFKNSFKYGFITDKQVDQVVQQGKNNLKQHGLSAEGLSRVALAAAGRATGKTISSGIQISNPTLEEQVEPALPSKIF